MHPVQATFQYRDQRALGTKKDMLAKLATLNVGPDKDGGTRLYGPGITVELVSSSEDKEVVNSVWIEGTGMTECEIGQLSLDRIQDNFPDWPPPIDDDHTASTPEDTDEFFGIEEFMK